MFQYFVHVPDPFILSFAFALAAYEPYPRAGPAPHESRELFCFAL
jgi:hypothetical protein